MVAVVVELVVARGAALYGGAWRDRIEWAGMERPKQKRLLAAIGDHQIAVVA